MGKKAKGTQDSDDFRTKVTAVLSDRDGWEGYEAHLRWLKKLLSPDRGYAYTSAERAGLSRIKFARTPFEGWDGYSVPDLIAIALQYVADFDYEDELFLRELQARGARLLRIGDMRCLVGLCRIAGLDISRFDPELDFHEDAV
jgi:hypothetical protein